MALIAIFPLTADNLPYVDTIGGYTIAASDAAYQGTSPGPAWHLTNASTGTITVDSFTPLAAAPMTLAVQVYFSASSAGGDYGFVTRGLGDTDYFELFMPSGGSSVAARTRGSTIADSASSAAGTNSAWHNCAAVYASTTSRRVYLDGTLGSAETTSVTVSGTLNRLSVLSMKRSADTVNVCSTDVYAKWVAVWDEALTQAQLDTYFADPSAYLGGGSSSVPRFTHFYTQQRSA